LKTVLLISNIVSSRHISTEAPILYKCPAAGTYSFSTTQGLNSHLQNVSSCKWYKLGKRRELDREDEDMDEFRIEGLPDGLVDEMDDTLSFDIGSDSESKY
jgi:hypothetical protein